MYRFNFKKALIINLLFLIICLFKNYYLIKKLSISEIFSTTGYKLCQTNDCSLYVFELQSWANLEN